MTYIFWISLLCIGYTYFGYPLMLLSFRLIRRLPAPARCCEPSKYSLIVTAHNEAAEIGAKIENCLEIQDVRLEVIVASDSSTDDTDEIVKTFASRGVRLIKNQGPKGKEYAQKKAIEKATGDILVFTDVGTRIEPGSFSNLSKYFTNSGVGAVSSVDKVLGDDGQLAGEGLYVRYEMLLRRLESSVAGLIGLSGSFFAARAEICMEWDVESPSDFNTALNCAKTGRRAITAPDVSGIYKELAEPSQEYRRKVRTVLRGITGLARHAEFLSIRKYGLFAWQLLSHKVLRWLVPFFLALLLISSVYLSDSHSIYLALSLAQLATYGVAFGAYRVPKLQQFVLIRLILFFCQANLAIFHAVIQFLQGKRMVSWQPSTR